VSIENDLARLMCGLVDVIPADELATKLALARGEGRPLRVKLGADPSAPDLHLGHTVVLGKLREFQELGHTVIFLIGDFTARIGDPSGRSETRKPLSDEEVRRNAATYTDQAFHILDRPRTEVRFNSEWMAAMGADDLVRLCSHYTVARILERDDFEKRFRANRPIGIHEFLIRSPSGPTSSWAAPTSASISSSAAKSRRPTASPRRPSSRCRCSKERTACRR
jgi:tyrosyl-tRNA synthetase